MRELYDELSAVNDAVRSDAEVFERNIDMVDEFVNRLRAYELTQAQGQRVIDAVRGRMRLP